LASAASKKAQIIGYLTIAALALAAYLVPVPENNRGDGFRNLSLFAVVAVIMGRLVYLLVRRHPSPTQQFITDVKTHWPWLLKSAIVFFSLAITLETGSGIKKSIPAFSPFYADPFLIDLDRWIFGLDPWVLTHAVFGWATPAILWIYDGWHFVHIGLAIWIALSFDDLRKIKFALCFQLAWLLMGGALATYASSVGPVMVADFYPDTSFAPLIDTLRESAPRVLAVKNVLIATMDDPLIISGISAMPSMHVAIAVLFALWLQSHRNAWLSAAGWAYAAIIYISSIHLGWHYATDGPVSAAFIICIWWAIGKVQALSMGRTQETPPETANPSSK